MSKEIHVGVQPLSRSEWVRLFEQNGLKVTWSNEAPMHMLEPRRVLRDEGWGAVCESRSIWQQIRYCASGFLLCGDSSVNMESISAPSHWLGSKSRGNA